MNSHTSPTWPFFLGCPVWACDQWAGRVYPERTPRNDWLSWYSRTFNTVEGNSTFYAMPSQETMQRWAQQVATGFQFCLKFPRSISHELELRHAEEETRTFLRCIEPLANAEVLGPTFLQLGPRFGPERFDALDEYLSQLPQGFDWAVELRHPGWFDQADNEHRVNDLLSRLQIDKVLLDSRPLYQCPPEDEMERVSQSRKPKTPVRQTVTANCPMLRIIGRDRIELVDRFFDQWAPIVSNWIRNGRKPYVFTHAPDDMFAPDLARRFAAEMQCRLGEATISVPRPPASVRQLSLLDEDR
ncbi:MAG: DUF72 domain-containing protein [Pirellulaceae bacterium]|nr:DUF72 domain-containing protein [Pirellulaceae bacterium]